MAFSKQAAFREGEVLFHEGDGSHEVYNIRSGVVRLEVRRHGRLVPVARLGPGSWVGETGLLFGTWRGVTARAVEPVRADVIEIQARCSEDGPVSTWILAIAQVVAERVRRMNVLLSACLPGPRGELEETARLCTSDDRTFVIEYDEAIRPGWVKLRGHLAESNLNDVKETLRGARLQSPNRIVVDLSDIIDIDTGVLPFLHALPAGRQNGDHSVVLENVHLVRSKLITLKNTQSLVKETHAPILQVHAGDVVLRQGELDDTMYVVKAGQFTVMRGRTGAEVRLGVAQPGDLFGEMSLFGCGPRSASVRAETGGRLYVIDSKALFESLEREPEWFVSLTRNLVERLWRTDRVLEALFRLKTCKGETSLRPVRT